MRSANGFSSLFSPPIFRPGHGMAAAYGIVKHHGGYIYIDSEVGRGTVVHILLPQCRRPVKNSGTVEPVSGYP